MSSPQWIIDGYNLLHALGWARARYGPGQLQKLRERLAAHVANRLPAQERPQTVLVFDAFSAPQHSGPRRQQFREVWLQFAEPGTDADSLIERLIREHSAPRRLGVVSDDRRLQTAAKRRRSQPLACRKFLTLLARYAVDHLAALEHELPTEKQQGITDHAELLHWLEEFSDVAAEVELTSDPDLPTRVSEEIHAVDKTRDSSRRHTGDHADAESSAEQSATPQPSAGKRTTNQSRNSQAKPQRKQTSAGNRSAARKRTAPRPKAKRDARDSSSENVGPIPRDDDGHTEDLRFWQDRLGNLWSDD